MTPVLLALLAIVDSAFCGYRAAAGRSALIDKQDYYARAMRRGSAWGLAAVGIAGLAAAWALETRSDSRGLLRDLLRVGDRMLQVYVPYALILGLAFLARALPSVDVRSLTSTLVFGPLTLLRVPVVTVGVGWGVLAAPGSTVLALAALVLMLMLGMEPALGLRYRRAHQLGLDASRASAAEAASGLEK